MVAYAYAAQFPSEVQNLVVMDAFLPGVGEWESIYNNPSLWHFRFNGPTPEGLVEGRERIYFEHFWNDFAADKMRSLSEDDRKAYTTAYSRPGRMRAGWAYFVSFQQAAQDFAQLSRNQLKMPVLVIGGEKSLGEALAQQMKLVASDVTVVVPRDTGHWVMEERPSETTEVGAAKISVRSEFRSTVCLGKLNMRTQVERRTVDLSGYPDLVVIYLGMRVNRMTGIKTLLGFGPEISTSVAARPEGRLRHETIIYSLFPMHVGMRQYWRDVEPLLKWTRSDPPRQWWQNFLKNSGGTGFWHETYFRRGGMEAGSRSNVRRRRQSREGICGAASIG